MKETKYKNVRVGSNIFTCRLDKTYDVIFGVTVNISVFEYHDIPVNSWQQFIETFKYKHYTSTSWHQLFSSCTLNEYLYEICEATAEIEADEKKAEEEWKNI